MNYIWENILKKNRKKDSLRTCLKLNYLFQDLSSRELDLVANIIHKRTFHTGEPVFHQGEIGVGMYIIMRGSVDIYLHDNQRMDQQEKIFVTRLEAGDFFGELALIEDNSIRTATAISQNESLLIGFFRPDLLEIVNRSPSCGSKIILRLSEVLGRRLIETTDRVSELGKELKELQAFTNEESLGNKTPFTT